MVALHQPFSDLGTKCSTMVWVPAYLFLNLRYISPLKWSLFLNAKCVCRL